MKNKKGFTLIEILVVVLIIGILAAIAVPYYQESVEKSIMQEAIVNLRTIAKANDVFYLQNNRYANYSEIGELDISIPGEIKNPSATALSGNRVMTKYFLYTSGFGGGAGAKAVAHRVKEGVSDYQNNASYYLYISEGNRLYCGWGTTAQKTETQDKLCLQIRQNGYL